MVANSDSLNIDHRLTITTWIKKETNKPYAGLVGNDWFGYTLMFNSIGNKLRLELAHGSQHEFATFLNSHIIENNIWYHIVVIMDVLNNNTNKITFYVNGQKGSEKSTSYSDLSDMPKLYIGYEGYGNRYFQGIIDDIRIYNRALSESEIKQLYQGCQPSIDIILNSNNRVTGDKVVINSHIKAPASLDSSCQSSKVTAKIWAKLPNNSIISLIKPTGFTLLPGNDIQTKIFEYIFRGAESIGSYEISGRLLDQFTGDSISTDIETLIFSK
ncbi:LamG domain-containing protein [Candidatus Marithrix sp. Canyon 246]|uniref:LamG domain-containing protein n=1 Tax=Candidatus Marithrix sp. Canyon 246 TaxID=1827136 RepID=UPI00084A0C3B|nr:LamG domain-containing protein [Candidatus Marithrix sp. Canyon 246]